MMQEKKVTDAIIVAACPALAYLLAYAYDAGRAAYYGLPRVAMTPTLGTVIAAIAALAAILVVAFILFDLLWSLLPDGTNAIYRKVIYVAVQITYLTLLWWVALDGWNFVIASLATIVLLGVSEILIPLVRHRKFAGVERRLEIQEIESSAAHSRSLVARLVSSIGLQPTILLLCSSAMICFAYQVGRASARTQEDFFVPIGMPEYVVASMHDDTLILAAYESQTSILCGKYLVRRIPDSPILALEQRHVGKLRKGEKDDLACRNTFGPPSPIE